MRLFLILIVLGVCGCKGGATGDGDVPPATPGTPASAPDGGR